jgi:hypothetical protein
LSSIERTAYPRFPRLISARELHVFYTPASEEITWAGEVTNSDESLLGLVLALKCFQRMGRFPRDEEIPELVVDHVRRGLGWTRAFPLCMAVIGRGVITWAGPETGRCGP